jgi:predicted nucleic acid-binding protein
MILLDTSSLVHFLRRKGDPAVKERVRGILRSGDAAICPMVAVELSMGVGSEKDRRDVEELCELLISLPIDESVWAEAMHLGRVCRRVGRPVPASDLVIAACARVHGARIEAADAHFEVISSISSAN